MTCPRDFSSSREPSLLAEAQAGAQEQQKRHGRKGSRGPAERAAAGAGWAGSARSPVRGPGRVRVLKTSRCLIGVVQCPPIEIKPKEGGEPGESGRMRPVPRLDGGGAPSHSAAGDERGDARCRILTETTTTRTMERSEAGRLRSTAGRPRTPPPPQSLVSAGAGSGRADLRRGGENGSPEPRLRRHRRAPRRLGEDRIDANDAR
jgi:hypothetical protein